MKKKLYFLTAILIITSVFVFCLKAFGIDNFSNGKVESYIEKDPLKYSMKMIEEFYAQKCNGESVCTKCFRDYQFPKEPVYYCFTYNRSSNGLTGHYKCEKDMKNCIKYSDFYIFGATENYEFDKNGRLISKKYKGYNRKCAGTCREKNVKVTYKYDSLGRITNVEMNEDLYNYSGYTKIKYSYNNGQQTEEEHHHFVDFPVIGIQNVKYKRTKTCVNDCCKYSSRYLPYLAPSKYSKYNEEGIELN